VGRTHTHAASTASVPRARRCRRESRIDGVAADGGHTQTRRGHPRRERKTNKQTNKKKHRSGAPTTARPTTASARTLSTPAPSRRARARRARATRPSAGRATRPRASARPWRTSSGATPRGLPPPRSRRPRRRRPRRFRARATSSSGRYRATSPRPASFDLRVDGVPRVFGFASMACRVDTERQSITRKHAGPRCTTTSRPASSTASRP
jgi:hypothetical protein